MQRNAGFVHVDQKNGFLTGIHQCIDPSEIRRGLPRKIRSQFCILKLKPKIAPRLFWDEHPKPHSSFTFSFFFWLRFFNTNNTKIILPCIQQDPSPHNRRLPHGPSPGARAKAKGIRLATSPASRPKFCGNGPSISAGTAQTTATAAERYLAPLWGQLASQRRTKLLAPTAPCWGQILSRNSEFLPSHKGGIPQWIGKLLSSGASCSRPRILHS